ncbi:MAG: type IV pili methyl-accepting chemotaxis transducer N-terminal domain-containing protein [Verrucomicrobiota bacterium]
MTLTERINKEIDDIERSAKTAQLVSINASVIAVKTRSVSSDAYAFEAVADQIKSISEASISRIGSLKRIVDELRELSSTINVAGRQRMLSQRIMKLHLSCQRSLNAEAVEAYRREMGELIHRFEATMPTLISSKLNTDVIRRKLEDVDHAWRRFKDSLKGEDVVHANELNDAVLEHMNDAVMSYEALAGR